MNTLTSFCNWCD